MRACARARVRAHIGPGYAVDSRRIIYSGKDAHRTQGWSGSREYNSSRDLGQARDSIEFRHRILANDMFSLEVLQQQSGNLRMHSQEMLKWANGYASQDLPSVFSSLRAPLQWLMLIAMEGPDKDVLCVERGYFRFCWAG